MYSREISSILIASILAGCAAPLVAETQSPVQLPKLDFGTPSPTPDELLRIHLYCEKLGYKVTQAETWKVDLAEKSFAYSYCEVDDGGITRNILVGYQNTKESVNLNHELMVEEIDTDGERNAFVYFIDDKGEKIRIMAQDEAGNKMAVDMKDPTNNKVFLADDTGPVSTDLARFIKDFWAMTVSAAELEETETPIAVVPTATVPDTEVPIETPTATVEVEKTIEYLTEKIEYGGYQFDFSITAQRNDEFVEKAFENYGIEGFSTNEGKSDGKALLAESIISSYLKTYNIQNKTNVGLEEYMGNPSVYPIKVDVRDKDGIRFSPVITLDQIKEFELRYSSGMNGELYIGDPTQSSYNTGFGLEEDKFVFYAFLNPADNDALQVSNMDIDESLRSCYLALYVTTYPLGLALGFLPFSTFSAKDRRGEIVLDGGNVIDDFYDISETRYPGKMSDEQFYRWIVEKSTFFKLELK